jgi:tRNA 5-methylaminomethyl-2-thiouridine biosynthesis bifunctional protein
MRIDFSELSRNAKAIINKAGAYYPGLFVNVAHGSNGLTSCPLSGEFLASLMSKENSPLSSAQAQSLNPARFLMRELKKQRMD